MKIAIPYILGATEKRKVIWADEILFEFFDSYMTTEIDAVEEVLKDDEDAMLGVKQTIKKGKSYILKSSICAVHWGYDNSIGCYDVTIMQKNTEWGYNCKDKAAAESFCKEIIKWWLGV